MSAYGYPYESSAAAASGYLSGGRGHSSFGNPASYGMPGSALGAPYGSSAQPGSIQGLGGVATSVASGMSPASHSNHHSHNMQTSSTGYSTAPPHLGSGSTGIHGFTSAYGTTGPSSYSGLMSPYQNCPSLSDSVLHQGGIQLILDDRLQNFNRPIALKKVLG